MWRDGVVSFAACGRDAGLKTGAPLPHATGAERFLNAGAPSRSQALDSSTGPPAVETALSTGLRAADPGTDRGIVRRPVVSRNPFELGTGDARLPNDGERGADA